MTSIRYFIPEDGDDEISPNVFLAPKARHPGSPPTLGQIRDAFPLPGRYHFRFKSPLIPGGDRDKGSMAVWMDCTRDNVPVPTWRGTIVAKVTRTGVEDDDDDEDDSDFAGVRAHVAPAPAPRPPQPAPVRQQPAPAPVPRPAPAPASEPLLDVFGGPSPPASHGVGATGNLFDPTPNHAPAASASTLLDMDNHHYPKPQASNNLHSDFLGMTAPAPSAPMPQTPVNQMGGFNPNPGQPYGHMGQPQQHPQSAPRPQANTAFNNFSNQNAPFGDLGTPWK